MPIPIIPIIGVMIAAGSFVVKLLGKDNDPKEVTEIKNKLNQVADNLEEVNLRLQLVLLEMKLENAIKAIGKNVLNIKYNFQKMELFGPGMDDEAKEWAKRILDSDNGIDRDLFTLHEVMMGRAVIPEPMMLIFKERLAAIPTGQSNYWEFINYFFSWQLMQTQGIVVMANAMRVLDPKLSDTDLKQRMQKNIDYMQEETNYAAKLLTDINEFYRDPALFSHYYIVPPFCPYLVDSHQMVTDPGFLITGMSLYNKKNRLALKIHQSRPAPNGRVLDQGSVWKINDDLGSNFFSASIFCDSSNVIEQHVTSEAPVGHVVTGAQLKLHGNCVGLYLQTAELDWGKGELNETSRGWREPSRGKRFSQIAHLQIAINTKEVVPSPHSYITGARLFLYHAGVGLDVRTRFLNL